MESAPYIVMNADVGGSHITTASVAINKQRFILENLIREGVITQSIVKKTISSLNSCILRISKYYRSFNITIPRLFDYKKGISKIKNVVKFDSLFGLNLKGMSLSYPENIPYNKPNYKPN